ncbi:MAG: polysaccharide deacetylase family protein [Clostridia bacterium]|nr:polysaccharide deacetylase family protein [Clostridia bacterium]
MNNKKVHQNKNHKIQQRKRRFLFTALICFLLLSIILIISIVSCSSVNNDITTPDPTVVPTPEPTATPIPSYYGKVSITDTSEEFTDMLPRYKEVNASSPMIAITIDDLDLTLSDNLSEIIDIAIAHNSKLTLFPIGSQLNDPSIRHSLSYAFSRGFQIENHTMNHQQVYQIPNEELYHTIVDQQAAVSELLGVDYKMRFFRLPGGNGEVDPRVHFYLRYLGYEALLDWSISGSGYSLSYIKEHLKPGSIILFHTTTSDLKKIRQLIPYVVQQGYRVVTINELLGYPENECYIAGTQPVPEYIDYIYDKYVVMKKGQKSYPVSLLQERLIELNYLPVDAKADGIFGEQTESAVKLFQISHGLDTTGKADIGMQMILFSENAKYYGY